MNARPDRLFYMKYEITHGAEAVAALSGAGPLLMAREAPISARPPWLCAWTEARLPRWRPCRSW